MKRHNPDTSIAAYKSLEATDLRDIYLRIVSALIVLGQGTFEDIAAHLKIDKSRVWKRLSEMERDQLIHRPGAKKKLSSGRNGYLWSVTEQLKKELDATEKWFSHHQNERAHQQFTQPTLF